MANDFTVKGGISGFDDIERGFDGINGQIEESNKSLLTLKNAGLAAAAAGFAAVSASLVSSTKQYLDQGDKIQKLSIRLGASTEALSQFRYVADQTGVTFESLTTALQRQTRRLSEAADGGGAAAKALDELGINAAELSRLAPEKQFLKLADSLGAVDSHSKKVALAMALWDTEGVAMLQTVEGGSASILKMMERADALGLTLDDVSANSIAGTNDAFNDLMWAVQGVTEKALGPLMPTIESISRAFLDSISATDGFSNASYSLETVLKGLILAGNVLKNTFDVFMNTLTATAQAAVHASQGEFKKAWDALSNGGKSIVSDFNDVKKTIDNLFFDTKETVKKVNTEITKNTTEELDKLTISLVAEQKEMENAWQAYADNVKINEDASRKELEKNWAIYKENLDINNQAILDQAQDKWKETETKHGEHVDKLENNIGVNFKEVFESTFNDYQTLGTTAFEAITTELGEQVALMIIEGEKFNMEAAFKAVLSNLIATSVSMVVEWAVMTAANTAAHDAHTTKVITNNNLMATSTATTSGSMAASSTSATTAMSGGWAASGSAFMAYLGIFIVAQQVLHEYRDEVRGFFDGIAAGFDKFFNFVKGGFDKLGTWVIGWAEPVLKSLMGLFDGIGNILNGVAGFIQDVFQGLGNFIGNIFDGIGKVADGLGKGIIGVFKGVKGFVSGVFDGFGKLIDALWAKIIKFVNWAKNAIGGIADAASSLNLNNIVSGGSNSGTAATIGGVIAGGAGATVGWIGGATGWFASGGSFLANGPQLIGVGESGAERVTIEPAGTFQKPGGSGTTYVFNGPVIMDDITRAKFTRNQIRGLAQTGSRYAGK